MQTYKQRRNEMIGKITSIICTAVLAIAWYRICLLGEENILFMILSIISMLLLIRVQNPHKKVKRYARKIR